MNHVAEAYMRLRAALIVVATIGSVAAARRLPSQTPVPMVKLQAPGFHRMMLGDFEITALNDGVVGYATSTVLPGATPERIANRLSAMGLTDPVGMSYNAYLVNTGTKLVLIDTGTGGKLADSPFFRGTGRLIANLRAAGYQPEQIDEIYITHLGPDHVGGLTRGALRAFPNARLRASRKEMDNFLKPDQAPAWTRSWTKFWSDLFAPYAKAGKVESFEEPSLTSSFDGDQEAAAAERRRILQMAVERDYWLAGAHLSFPGLGHVRSAQDGFQWIPANYGIPQ